MCPVKTNFRMLWEYLNILTLLLSWIVIGNDSTKLKFKLLNSFVILSVTSPCYSSLRCSPMKSILCLDSSGDYFDRLKSLIEETVDINEGRKIMLISHSMGVPYSLRFLHQQSQEWKDKYIEAWITISGRQRFVLVKKRS